MEHEVVDEIDKTAQLVWPCSEDGGTRHQKSSCNGNPCRPKTTRINYIQKVMPKKNL